MPKSLSTSYFLDRGMRGSFMPSFLGECWWAGDPCSQKAWVPIPVCHWATCHSLGLSIPTCLPFPASSTSLPEVKWEPPTAMFVNQIYPLVPWAHSQCRLLAPYPPPILPAITLHSPLRFPGGSLRHRAGHLSRCPPPAVRSPLWGPPGKAFRGWLALFLQPLLPPWALLALQPPQQPGAHHHRSRRGSGSHGHCWLHSS